MNVLKLRRGGQRGQQPWRKPTDRDRVISGRLAEKVKEETGLVVDPEIARAVRWTVLRWSERTMFDSDSELQTLTARARFDRQRAYAMKLLHDAETELSSWLEDTEDEDFEDTEDEDFL